MNRPVAVLLSITTLAWCALVGTAAAADVATAPDGTVTVVSGLQFMRIAPDGSHTAYLPYASRVTDEEGAPVIAIGPDGTATVVWIRSGAGPTEIVARRIAADGSLEGEPVEIGQSDDPHVYPKAAVAADGTATVVWVGTEEGQTGVIATRIAPDGTIELAPTELGNDSSYQPDLAVAPDGTATVAWQQFGEDRAVASARQIAPDGTLGPSLPLSDGIGSAQPPRVAMTDAGAAVVTWEAMYWPSAEGGSEDVVEERRIAPDGTVDGPVNTLTEHPNGWAPVLAAAPDGTVTVAWWQLGDDAVLARRIAPDGTPEGSVIEVSSPGTGSVYPEIGIAADGSATLTWTDGWQLFSRRLGADGTPLGPQLEVLNSNGRLGLIGMGSDASGNALPIWSRRLGYYETEYIQQARRLFADGSAGPIFNLTEPGTEPATWADPEAIDFGAAAAGTSVVRAVVFTNRSVDSTPVSGVSISGPDAGQFAIVDDSSCTSQPIAFVQSCTVTVAFAPSATGPMEAELALAASAPRQPRVVSLSGFGLPEKAKGDPPGPEPKAASATAVTEGGDVAPAAQAKSRCSKRASRASGTNLARNRHNARASGAPSRSSLGRCHRGARKNGARPASSSSRSRR